MSVRQEAVLLLLLGAMVLPAGCWTSAFSEYRLLQCPPLFNCYLGCELKKSPINGCEKCECEENPCASESCPRGLVCSKVSPWARAVNLPTCIPELMFRLLPNMSPVVATTTTTTTTPAPPAQERTLAFKCPPELVEGPSNWCQPGCQGASACMKLSQLNVPVCCAVDPTQAPKIITPSSNSGCQEPLEVGPCRASHERFGYNSAIGRCEVFHYGGCSPNRNNFETLTECQLTCETSRTAGASERAGDVVGNDLDPCEQPPTAGFCRAMFRRFYYDRTTNACLAFTYGGCGSNGNNFPTRGACEQRCVQP